MPLKQTVHLNEELFAPCKLTPLSFWCLYGLLLKEKWVNGYWHYLIGLCGAMFSCGLEGEDFPFPMLHPSFPPLRSSLRIDRLCSPSPFLCLFFSNILFCMPPPNQTLTFLLFVASSPSPEGSSVLSFKAPKQALSKSPLRESAGALGSLLLSLLWELTSELLRLSHSLMGACVAHKLKKTHAWFTMSFGIVQFLV